MTAIQAAGLSALTVTSSPRSGTSTRHRVGTGLGLALVAEHAQAHGGEAWVEDRPGGGARFKVSLSEAW